jgi:hypothetical protein
MHLESKKNGYFYQEMLVPQLKDSRHYYIIHEIRGKKNTCHLDALLQLQPVGPDPLLLVTRHHTHDEPCLPPELPQLVHLHRQRDLALNPQQLG